MIMSLRTALGLVAVPFALVSACAPELYKRDGIHPIHKRQNTPNRVEDSRGWSYDNHEDWNTLSESWGYCFNGTQQTPIAYESSMGSSRKHQPQFNYPENLTGTISNWDFGAQFEYHHESGDKPSLKFNENGKDETVYFKSWHTHTPAEHTIDGWRPKAEMHFVHKDVDDNYRAVVSFLIDRSEDSEGSEFFAQLPTIPSFFSNSTVDDVELNLNLAIKEVSEYTDFFTYQGSLTTPPCYEGLRWFVAKTVIRLSDEQMVELLGKSTYSARPIQPVWLHHVNA